MTSSRPAPPAPAGGSAPPPPAGSRSSATPRDARRAFDEPPWRVWTAPAAIGLGLAFGAVASIVVAVVAQVGGSSVSHPSAAVNIIGNVLFDLAFVVAALYFVRLQGRPRAADFGFRQTPLRLGGAVFLIGGVGYYVLTALYAAILGLHGSERLPTSLGVGRSTAADVAVVAFVCVIAPIAEEFFFRGFIFGALRRWRIQVGRRNIGTLLAGVVTAILFGLAHAGSASPKYLVPLALLGLILCFVRWRTASLYPCIALHSFNNCLAVGLNQFHWNLAEIFALMAGSLLVIGAATGPLSFRTDRAAS
ncbi:MAG: CPBP family intramembrane glutamic endopeptidase [Solirubrobacteraceae bacterium]